MYCFDKNTGKKLWEYNTGRHVEASPVIVKDKVIVANMRGDVGNCEPFGWQTCLELRNRKPDNQ